MSRVVPTTIISNWHYGATGLQQSSDVFYREVERVLNEHKIDHMKIERVQLYEGGLFSAKREYLQVRRNENVFLICAAPFGNGFFISWWLGYVESSFWAKLAGVPVIGFLVRNLVMPMTYYKLDTAWMFQSVTHSVVSDVLNAMLSAKGMKALSDVERAPVMRDFFAQLGGA